jgi:integrase
LPRRSLTAASLNRIKPPARGQVDHFDNGYPGLALRVSYGGGKSWVYFYRLGGKLRRMTLGPLRTLAKDEKEPKETKPGDPLTLASARDAWRDARQEVLNGRDPALTRKRQKPATDFRGVSAEWLHRDQAGNRSHDEVKRILDHDVLPHWGQLSVSDIGRRDALDLIDGIADRGAPVMARRVHAHLHRFFRWAVGRGVIEANPMADLPKPGGETKRDRVLTDDELRAVWKAADDLGWPFGPAIQLLILTGARREEIGALRWGEIDIDGAQIKLEGSRTKSGDSHTIALSTRTSAVLSDIQRISESDFVFTTTGKTPVSGWSKAKADVDAAAAIDPPWRLHDLRRTVATGLQRLGVGLQAVEAVLGHVSGSRAGVVGIYQRHSFDAEKRAALEAWGAHVMDIVHGKKAGKVLPMRRKR